MQGIRHRGETNKRLEPGQRSESQIIHIGVFNDGVLNGKQAIIHHR